MSLAVELRDIRKSFGGREVLKGIDALFPAGAISVIVGPNGSGKSTLLRVMARLERADSGSVICTEGGRAVPADLSLMRRMTLVSQGPALFNTTLEDNIAYGLKFRDLPKETVRRRVAEAVEAGGLSRLAHARARSLSGGEAQRAAVVRAYALRPELIFLDEPTANLDPEGVALVEALIRRMRDEHGTTVVMVTHNLFQARRLAGRVSFMYGGEVVESGDAAAFFRAPERELTRKFLSGEVVY